MVTKLKKSGASYAAGVYVMPDGEGNLRAALEEALEELHKMQEAQKWIPVSDGPQEFHLDFGDYCRIEQYRFGVENEIYTYKVIGTGRANYFKPVPVRGDSETGIVGEMEDVVKCICCGVSETEVETFRLCDVLLKPSTEGSSNA